MFEGKRSFRTRSIGRKSNADCTPDVMESLVLSLLAAPLALALVEFATSQLASVQGLHGPLLHMEDIDRTALAFITGTTLLTCRIRTRSVNCGVQVLVRSFLRVLSVDMGFRSEHVASLGIVG
jgi:hypothetical protein